MLSVKSYKGMSLGNPTGNTSRLQRSPSGTSESGIGDGQDSH